MVHTSDESTIVEQFQRMAHDARAAAELLSPHEATIKKLREAAQEIGKAWSKGWFGYHARIYKADLSPVRPGEYWDVDLAWDPVGDTHGEWREFTHDTLIETIRKNAGNPDLQRIDHIIGDIQKTFDRVRCSDSRCARWIGSNWHRRRSRRRSERLVAVARSTETRGRRHGVRAAPGGRSVPAFS